MSNHRVRLWYSCFVMGLTAWIQILDAAGAILGFASLFAILFLIGRNASKQRQTPQTGSN